MPACPGGSISGRPRVAGACEAAMGPVRGKLARRGTELRLLRRQCRGAPGRPAFAVVAGFRFGPADLGQTQQVEVRLVDAENKLVVPAANLQFQAQGTQLEPGQEISLSTVT